MSDDIKLYTIENPKLDSLVHCFKLPDSSLVFGDVSEYNENEIDDLRGLDEFFSGPYDHAAFIFLIPKNESEALFDNLTSPSFMTAVAEDRQNGIVCFYEDTDKDLVILIEPNGGINSKAYLEMNNSFNHTFHYVQYFYTTEERMDGTDKDFFNSLGNNQELLDFLNFILEK